MNSPKIVEALKSSGWLFDGNTGTWSHNRVSGFDFEQAICYAIRFGSADLPTLGDNVKVISGPFLDFLGVVEEVDLEKGVIQVLVDIFGRKTSIRFNLGEIKIIDNKSGKK